MGRPRIEWTDTQLGQILAALPALDRDTREDNARFLDGLIAEVRTATGRLYGATAYDRLLRQVAPQAGVERRPSSATVQAAVLRAQSLAAQPEARSATAARAKNPRSKKAQRGGAQKAVRNGVQRAVQNADTAIGADALQLQLTQAALADAHARIVRLEEDAAQLRRALGRAEAARDLAGKHVNAMLEGLHDAIAGSGASAAALTQALARFEGAQRAATTRTEPKHRARKTAR